VSARLAADALVALHLAFIAFVVAGGALTLVDRRWAIVHLPAVVWAAWTEFTATVCPLTPWENVLRAKAGAGGYSESFIEHYIVPVVYPQGLTPDAQFALGTGVVVLTIVVYAIAWRRHARARAAERPPQHMTRSA
jgi:Protein of Unknown function (DUF2784)